MSDLEGAYRRLLRVYPRWYREQRGEEILSTLLDAARPAQRRPSAGEAVGLVVHGAATRVGVGPDGSLAGVLGAGASPMLVAGGVLASVALVLGGAAQGGPGVRGPGLVEGAAGPVAPVLYGVWVLAVVLDVATRQRYQRSVVALAVLASVIALPVADLVGLGRPRLFVVAALVAFGAPSLLRPAWTLSHQRPAPMLVGGLAALAMLASCALGALGPSGVGSLPGSVSGSGFYQGLLATLAAWTPLAALAVLAVAAGLVVAGRAVTAGVLAASSVPWLVICVGAAPRHSTATFGAVLLVAVLAVFAVAGVSHRPGTARSGLRAGR